jgi:hypothetical protein
MRKILGFGYQRFGLVSLLLVSISPVAIAQTKQQAPSGAKTTTLSIQGPPWTGDLDGMLQRRYVRALIVYSKTQYYVVRGVQHGVAYESLIAFQDFINRKFPPKEKNLRHDSFRLFETIVSSGESIEMFHGASYQHLFERRVNLLFGAEFSSGSRLVFSASHQSLGFDFSWLNLFFAFGLLLRD